MKFILKDINLFLTDLLVVLHRLTSGSPVSSLGTQCSLLCTLSQPQTPVPGASLGWAPAASRHLPPASLPADPSSPWSLFGGSASPRLWPACLPGCGACRLAEQERADPAPAGRRQQGGPEDRIQPPGEEGSGPLSLCFSGSSLRPVRCGGAPPSDPAQRPDPAEPVHLHQSAAEELSLVGTEANRNRAISVYFSYDLTHVHTALWAACVWCKTQINPTQISKNTVFKKTKTIYGKYSPKRLRVLEAFCICVVLKETTFANSCIFKENFFLNRLTFISSILHKHINS